MASIDELRQVIDEFNRKYPRPFMAPIELNGPYNLRTEYCNPYPHGNLPGVYVICNSDRRILRIGKASCRSTITVRLGAYFKWGDGDCEGKPKHPGYEDATFVYTIGVDADRAFEVTAIEEYLIGRLDLPYNWIGRKKP